MARLFAGTPFDRPPRCERCGLLESECQCPPPEAPRVPPGKQHLRLAIERRKKGKTVTVVRGFQERPEHLLELLTTLKNLCGAGGTVDGENLEIQGEHVERIRHRLQELGYHVR